MNWHRKREERAQLLLGVMKGEELARSVRHLDRAREEEASSSRTTIFRRPSSVYFLTVPTFSWLADTRHLLSFLMSLAYCNIAFLISRVRWQDFTSQQYLPAKNIEHCERPLRRVIVVWQFPPHNDRRSPRRSFPIPKLTARHNHRNNFATSPSVSTRSLRSTSLEGASWGNQ